MYLHSKHKELQEFTSYKGSATLLLSPEAWEQSTWLSTTSKKDQRARVYILAQKHEKLGKLCKSFKTQFPHL